MGAAMKSWLALALVQNRSNNSNNSTRSDADPLVSKKMQRLRDNRREGFAACGRGCGVWPPKTLGRDAQGCSDVGDVIEGLADGAGVQAEATEGRCWGRHTPSKEFLRTGFFRRVVRCGSLRWAAIRRLGTISVRRQMPADFVDKSFDGKLPTAFVQSLWREAYTWSCKPYLPGSASSACWLGVVTDLRGERQWQGVERCVCLDMHAGLSEAWRRSARKSRGMG